jgi:hypothetical protein
MRWGAVFLAVMAAVIVAGCGGGDPDPIESADIHLEKTQGEYMLAKVELDRAWYRHAETLQGEDPEKVDQREQHEALEARRVLKECIEGNGLESCTSVEPIREIVAELNHTLVQAG